MRDTEHPGHPTRSRWEGQRISLALSVELDKAGAISSIMSS
jgi:hypothetical protein